MDDNVVRIARMDRFGRPIHGFFLTHPDMWPVIW